MSYMKSFIGCSGLRQTPYGNVLRVGGNINVVIYKGRKKLKEGKMIMVSTSLKYLELIEVSYCWNDKKIHPVKNFFNHSVFWTYIPKGVKSPELQVFTKVKFSDDSVEEHKHVFNIKTFGKNE